jgi:hypothetical protein
MAIKPDVGEQHTFRITGRVGLSAFSSEVNCTLGEARSKASQCEQRGTTDGIFLRGRAKIEKWDGNKYIVIDRYGK